MQLATFASLNFPASTPFAMKFWICLLLLPAFAHEECEEAAMLQKNQEPEMRHRTFFIHYKYLCPCMMWNGSIICVWARTLRGFQLLYIYIYMWEGPSGLIRTTCLSHTETPPNTLAQDFFRAPVAQLVRLSQACVNPCAEAMLIFSTVPRFHANLHYTVPILSGDPRRESTV